MSFIKQNWFKVLIALPLIPAVLFVQSLDSFVGIDESVRFLIGFMVLAATLFLLFFGLYLEFSKGNLKTKKFVFSVGNLRFGLIEITRALFSGIIVAFFVLLISVTNVSVRVGNVIDNVTITPGSVTRDYSLVVMAGFDVNGQNPYNRIGVLAITDDYKTIALEDFLYEQNFIINPVQVAFASPLDLINALYDQEVEAIIISSNLIQNFNDVDGFEHLDFDMLVLSEFTVTADEIIRANIDPGEPFSVLLLGLNTREDVSSGLGQINTFMLLTVNLQELSFTVTSIPRDSYVFIPCFGKYDKLSHTNWMGASCAVGAIEALFEIEIPYHVMLNFTGFMEIVDTLGGIYVDVPFRIVEQDSHRRRGDYLITLEPGLRRLNAEEALAFSRHRNLRGDSEMVGGDFARVGHQQIVFQAMLSEMFSQATGIGDILPLLEVLGRHVQTNLHANEIMAVAEYLLGLLLQTRQTSFGIMDNLHFINMVILGDTPMIRDMSVVLPWSSHLERAKELMLVNLGLIEPEFSFTFNFDGFNPTPHQWLISGGYGTGVLPPGISHDNVANYMPEVDQEPDYDYPYYPEAPSYKPPYGSPDYSPDGPSSPSDPNGPTGLPTEPDRPDDDRSQDDDDIPAYVPDDPPYENPEDSGDDETLDD